MSVCNKYMIAPDHELFLSRKTGKKVIISTHHMYRAVRNCRNIILIAFYVAEVYQHIQRLFFFYHTVKISVCPMRITYDQYLHILLS